MTERRLRRLERYISLRARLRPGFCVVRTNGRPVGMRSMRATYIR
ncbi:hypothetical protein BIFGAL_04176 [Bifidobacterium gallicum DSM 20093 = LMG 11596]|uniref:Uncharacterized protein n=1 Tax=Bifidobacterium gallicum DSM 20093 = LMG 11596 TaxID=561180 RepID=D1NWC7_9BIFI|nr:hypothetical protein BIFGAL_04176 [Bifidobacterium gallicum DSM 20093 = LMG 11596]